MGLELPEDTFVNMHNFNAVGESYGKLVHFDASFRHGN